MIPTPIFELLILILGLIWIWVLVLGAEDHD